MRLIILIIDNKDSFVWNLASYAAHYDEVEVMPNDSRLSDIIRMEASGMIISPGPGSPKYERYVGHVPVFIRELEMPILGVCLGHQIIAYEHGGKVDRIDPLHGKSSKIIHDGKGIFKNVKNPLIAGRYHSLAVTGCPSGFHVSARLEDGTIMGIRSADMRVEGVQFHPESILTDNGGNEGFRIIKNFVEHSKEMM